MRLHTLTLAAALALATPLTGHAQAAAASAAEAHVAWQMATTDADIDRAFAKGKAEGKPVLIYWGAAWCPPCNHLKSTLFNRADFIERTRHVVPVQIDGDGPGAQKLGARFKVRGYPTLVLFNAQGTEITRLPGEADAPMVMNLMEIALSGGRPVAAVLADARAGKPISPNEWRLLAYHSWELEDDDGLLPPAERAATLAKLAAAAPQPEMATRLWLKAVAAGEEGKPAVVADAASRKRLAAVLDSPSAARAQMDVLTNAAADLVQGVAPKAGAERDAMVKTYDAALVRLQKDATLSRADRLTALGARVDLQRLGQPKDALKPKLPPALVQEVKTEVARLDREVASGFERQAVITSGAHVLTRAGLWAESDALLKANLDKSHSPYYLMSQLAGNARKQGRNAEAVDWAAKAYDKSVGPATRLQWGASYVGTLTQAAPQDAKRIEGAASKVLSEAAGQQGAFFDRNARSLQRISQQVLAWNTAAKGRHQPVVERLRGQIAPTCAKLPAADGQKAACDGLFKA